MEHEPNKPIREQRQEKNEDPVTVYYLRHGESSEDKTDPLRGLTETGIQQVREAIERVAGEISDKESQIRLYSSGSERTRQQCIVAAEILKAAGFNEIVIAENSLPEKRTLVGAEHVEFGQILSVDEKQAAWQELATNLGLTIEGVGVAKRIAELKAPKEYITGLRRLEKESGTPAIIGWLTDKNIPLSADTPEKKAAIVQEAVEITNCWAQHMKEKKSKPIVALVFGHASALTAYGLRAFGKENDPEQIKAFGEVENAEGIKVSFSGDVGSRPEIKPFGEVIEQKVGQKE